MKSLGWKGDSIADVSTVDLGEGNISPQTHGTPQIALSSTEHIPQAPDGF